MPAPHPDALSGVACLLPNIGTRLGAAARESTQSSYYRARYYNSVLQRFISEDPIGLAGGINSYSYAGNSPANFRDPTGLDYNVNYDPNTNTLNVSAAVGIYGSDANN